VTAAAERELELLRAKLSGSALVRVVFEPPGFHDFAHGQNVVAWDPSLRHTGYIHFTWPEGRNLPWVFSRKSINLKTSRTGYEGTWDLAAGLHWEVRSVYTSLRGFRYVTAIEAPPVGGGDLRRRDSTEIAGSLIYAEARVTPSHSIYGAAPRHISSVLLGSVSHDKKEIAAAVLRYFPDSGGRDWSEGQRDAAAAGLTVLHDLRRAA